MTLRGQTRVCAILTLGGLLGLLAATILESLTWMIVTTATALVGLWSFFFAIRRTMKEIEGTGAHMERIMRDVAEAARSLKTEKGNKPGPPPV